MQDHEKLLRARAKCRKTPLLMVAALKKGESLDLPSPQVSCFEDLLHKLTFQIAGDSVSSKD